MYVYYRLFWNIHKLVYTKKCNENLILFFVTDKMCTLCGILSV